MDVNRTTVYRQVGNVDSILRLLMAREVHRQLSVAYERTNVDSLNPRGLVQLLAEMIRIVRGHPLVEKVLRDEPELVGGAIHPSTGLFTRIANFITPAIGLAMATGQIADRDPAVVAEWLARIAATSILSPPPGDLEDFLAELLIPALTPLPDS
jgi:AcrR family transcriptional regulator